VERRADKADGRAALMRLTRKGRALARRWPASFDSVVQALSARDQATLMGILVRAIDTLQRQGAISRQRMCLSCRYFAPNAHPGQARPHHCRLIDTALSEGDLRVDCPEHEAADAA
ncbi:MAG TPA: hypothetical protein PLS69_13105, partial [Terricaulis sp.]|nr:hypothetical protein [Terricaulis sp.]